MAGLWRACAFGRRPRDRLRHGVLAFAPLIAGVSLLLRLTSQRIARGKPTPAERLLGRSLSTGALVSWLVIPLLVIGLWATAVALTGGSGGSQPTIRPGGVVGVWKSSGGAMVTFTSDSQFTETNLPYPPVDDAAYAGRTVTVPRSDAGIWQFHGRPFAGFQEVDLNFFRAPPFAST